MGGAQLAYRHARHHWRRSLLLVLCVAAAAALPIGTRLIMAGFEAKLRARAASTPLVVGDRGSRFDLVFAAIYFRRPDLQTVSMADWRTLSDAGGCVAIPLNVRFTARGLPIVAASSEYAALRGLRCRAGEPARLLGECALGSSAAERLGLRPGDTLFSDQRELYDIAKPPSLKMKVVGVMAPTGTPDDDAVLVDINTAWVLEGLSHSHVADPTKAPESLVLERTEKNVALSEALVEENQVTPGNIGGFHLHAAPESLPLTAIIVIPDDEREATLIKARVNGKRGVGAMQAAVPTAVIEELLGYVVRVRSLVDVIAAMLGGVTCVLLGLVTALSVQVRAKEVQTLRRIGAGRGFVGWMFACEIVLVLAAGVLLAGVTCGMMWKWGPDPMKFLQKPPGATSE